MKWYSTEESTEGSAESSSDETTGGESDEDPDTGDISGMGIWLWQMVIAMVTMTGYVTRVGFDRKKQR